MIIAPIVAEQAGAQIGTQCVRMRMSARINKLKICSRECVHAWVGVSACMRALYKASVYPRMQRQSPGLCPGLFTIRQSPNICLIEQ